MDTYINVGADFIDAEGNRVTSIQLVDKESKGAIADAYFDNEKLIKCFCCDGVDKTDFLNQAIKLMENSVPISFNKTNLG
jgi:hypothetical protein